MAGPVAPNNWRGPRFLDRRMPRPKSTAFRAPPIPAAPTATQEPNGVIRVWVAQS